MLKVNLPTIKANKTALLIIDMQNDFTEKGAIIEVTNINKALTKFKKFIDYCRKKGVSIIYTRHNYSPQTNPIEAKLFPELNKKGLRKGTYGFDISDSIKPEKDDMVLDKNRYDAFYKTKLEKILKSKNITDIIIIGTMTNVCCESTARSAMYRDYSVWFVSDLNFTFDKKQHHYTLETIKTHFGQVLNSSKILEKIV
jgi:ureidoacrylate peracid hydrolase